ncbi:MAG TPA: caspase family protein [Pseudolabrys sp.]|nr:caspase family protein [Pseudolabrys sp.]
MHRLLALLCVTFLWLAATQASGQTVHAIIVGNSLDGQIGPGVTENLKNMSGLLTSLDIVGEITVVKTEVSGADFSCKSILQVVDKLEIKPADTVLFYYAGHGVGAPKISKFPEFACDDPPTGVQIGLKTIQDRIAKKKPHFLLAIADACNVPEGPAAAARPQFTPPPQPERKAALRHLFLDYTGFLLMSGSIPGQYSWYINTGETVGGYFTLQLLGAVNGQIAAKGARARWEDIAPAATKLIKVPTKPPINQKPQFQLLAKAKPQ